MNFPFFSQSKNHHRRIVIDVSNGSVSGASVIFQKNQKPVVEYATEIPLPIKERVDAPSLLANTEKALEKVVGDIHAHVKESGSLLVDVVCSSPWFSAETRSVTYERKDFFVVSEKLLRVVTDKEIKAMKSGAPSDTLLAEEQIAHMKLNGYETQNPFNKKAKRLELLLFSSFVPKSFVESVTRSIQHFLSAKRVTFHSFPFVSLRALSRVWHEEKDFVHLHVGAEVSELVVVKGGAISETFSFPLGSHHLTRVVADKRQISLEMAESLLVTAFRGDSIEPAQQGNSVNEILIATKEEWLAYVDNIISESSPEHQNITRLFISADPAMLHFWTSVVSSRAQKVVPLLKETFEQFIQTKPGSLPSVSTALEILYIDTLSAPEHLH